MNIEKAIPLDQCYINYRRDLFTHYNVAKQGNRGGFRSHIRYETGHAPAKRKLHQTPS
jgi:hypothetical protein